MVKNLNLSKLQIRVASKVYSYLRNKKKSFNILRLNLKKPLINFGVSKIDYLVTLNLRSLKKPKKKGEKFNIFIAYYLGKTRLIDNI